MPLSAERKKEYQREYMKRKRSGLDPAEKPVRPARNVRPEDDFDTQVLDPDVRPEEAGEVKTHPNYDINPPHKDGCVCMLCAPERWPDLKVSFEKHIPVNGKNDGKIYPNYDIHPKHAENCVCICCKAGIDSKTDRLKVIKGACQSLS